MALPVNRCGSPISPASRQDGQLHSLRRDVGRCTSGVNSPVRGLHCARVVESIAGPLDGGHVSKSESKVICSAGDSCRCRSNHASCSIVQALAVGVDDAFAQQGPPVPGPHQIAGCVLVRRGKPTRAVTHRTAAAALGVLRPWVGLGVGLALITARPLGFDGATTLEADSAAANAGEARTRSGGPREPPGPGRAGRKPRIGYSRVNLARRSSRVTPSIAAAPTDRACTSNPTLVRSVTTGDPRCSDNPSRQPLLGARESRERGPDPQNRPRTGR